MSLYIIFFFIRAGCLLAIGILEHVRQDKLVMLRHTLFFVSAVLGDIPLAFVMLFFLEHKTPSSTSGTSSTQTGGAGYGQAQMGYQYAAAEKRGDDLSQHVGREGYLSQSSEVVFSGTPPMFYNQMLPGQVPTYPPQEAPYYYPPQNNIDGSTSTNSYYVPDGGYV